MYDEVKMCDYIEKELQTYHIPGMGVSVSKEGQILISRGFGYKDLKAKEPIGSETMWGIASCSKAFTATLIAMLVDKGLIEYDTPIKDYLPDFEMYDVTATYNCTIRDILLHRTGLSEHDALWTDNADRADLFKRLKYLKPKSMFREEMSYNNLMYTIAGHIAERVSGMSWEDMVKEWIFRPLGMNDSDTTLIKMKDHTDVAMPHWEKNGHIEEIPFLNVSPGEPCVGVITCLKDAEKWMQFNLNEGCVDGKQLVSKKSMAELHKPQISTSIWPWKGVNLPKLGSYGLGWFITDYRGYEVVFHTGELEGYCTLMAFLPEEGITQVSFTNLHKPCVLAQFSVFYKTIDEMLGLEPVDWHGFFESKIGQFGDLYYHWDCNLLKEPPISGTKTSHPLEDYVGEYRNDGYGSFSIIEEENGLIGLFRGNRHILQHYHYDTFKVDNIKEDTILITAPLTFITVPESGQIGSLIIPLDPSTEPIEFKKIKKDQKWA